MNHADSKNKRSLSKAEADLLNERLASFLSAFDETTPFRVTVYLDFQIMSGKYVDKIDALATKHFRSRSRIKSIISEVENMEKSKLKRITNKLRSLLL